MTGRAASTRVEVLRLKKKNRDRAQAEYKAKRDYEALCILRRVVNDQRASVSEEVRRQTAEHLKRYVIPKISARIAAEVVELSKRAIERLEADHKFDYDPQHSVLSVRLPEREFHVKFKSWPPVGEFAQYDKRWGR